MIGYDRDWCQGIDWPSMRKYRIDRIVKAINDFGLDALMLTRLDAIRYVTSFRPVSSPYFHGTRHIVFVTKKGDIKFLCASGDYTRVKLTMPWITNVVPFAFVIADGSPVVLESVNELELTKAKVGVDLMPFSLYDPLRAAMPAMNFVNGLDCLDAAREIKSAEEIECLRQAAEIADVAMYAAYDSLKIGATENEVAANMCRAAIAAGSETMTNTPLVCGGPHSWTSYKVPTERRIKDGDMFYVDANPIFNGYNGDIARMPVVGHASPLQKKMYKTCYGMLQAATAEMKPGNSTDNVLAAATKVARDAEMEQYVYFGILGHGVGTDLHENPTIGDKATGLNKSIILKPGMVVALEPGINIPNVGGGHQENTIVITEDGNEVLNKVPFDDNLLS